MKKLICLCASALFLTACPKKSDPVENVRVAAKDKDLQKTFVSDCAAAPVTAVGTAFNTLFQGKTAGYKTSWKFTGDNVSKKLEAYDNTKCEGDANYQYEETGTFDVNKAQDTKSNDGGYPLDVNFTKVTLKVISDEGLKVANAAKMCGFEGWAKDKEQNVTKESKNANCYGAAYGQDGKRQVFTRYRVDNKILTLGTEEAKNPRERAAKLEAAKYFQK